MGVPKKKAGGKKPARPAPRLTAEEHYENAEMAFAMDNHPLARTSFKRALDMEPENVEFLEGYGSFLAEVGPRSEALAVLRRAAALAPDEGFEKYMYLGQLLEGPEAEQSVRKGIAILRHHMQQQAEEPAAAEGSEAAAEAAGLKQHLAHMLGSALCSLVELLMNQAQERQEGGLAGVEPECEALLGEARGLAPGSPEPLQALASLRQQQGKDEEALALLKQSLALWFKPIPDEEEEEEEGEAAEEGGKESAAERAVRVAQAVAEAEAEQAGEATGSGSGSEGGSSDSDLELMDEDEGDLMPSYEFRFEAAKLLLELDDSVETASQVLEQLLEENDQVPHVWQLLALCCQGGGDLEGALGAAEEGLQLCKKLKLPADDEALAAFESMKKELIAVLEGHGKPGGAAPADGAAAE